VTQVSDTRVSHKVDAFRLVQWFGCVYGILHPCVCVCLFLLCLLFRSDHVGSSNWMISD
jgi:hypothetical protein